eukprot:scaffold731_cov261-Pinguiococcus_pyrenoidosus.AAC.112
MLWQNKRDSQRVRACSKGQNQQEQNATSARILNIHPMRTRQGLQKPQELVSLQPIPPRLMQTPPDASIGRIGRRCRSQSRARIRVRPSRDPMSCCFCAPRRHPTGAQGATGTTKGTGTTGTVRALFGANVLERRVAAAVLPRRVGGRRELVAWRSGRVFLPQLLSSGNRARAHVELPLHPPPRGRDGHAEDLRDGRGARPQHQAHRGHSGPVPRGETEPKDAEMRAVAALRRAERRVRGGEGPGEHQGQAGLDWRGGERAHHAHHLGAVPQGLQDHHHGPAGEDGAPVRAGRPAHQGAHGAPARLPAPQAQAGAPGGAPAVGAAARQEGGEGHGAAAGGGDS